MNYLHLKFKLSQRLHKLLILFVCCAQITLAQWENQNTGINDNLTGVVFLQENGILSGANGLYITTSGGQGAASWNRFEITDNVENAAIYNNSSFNHVFTKPGNRTNTGYVFAAGVNQITQQAILIRISLPSLDYDIMFTGTIESELNKMDYSSNYRKFLAVGNNGLVLSFSDAESDIIPQTISTDFTDDLVSIDCYGGTCWFGTRDRVITVDLTYGNPNFSIYPSPGINHKAVYKSFSSDSGRSVGDNFVKLGNGNSTENTSYDFGPLNGNTIFEKNNLLLIGTDHGIFRSDRNKFYLEWQPSSSTYNINQIWSISNSSSYSLTTVYAVGDNGLLLKSDNDGGSTKPYARFNDIGGCVGSYVAFNKYFAGSSTSCKLYVDNVLESTNCGESAGEIYNETGTHDVRLVATNDYGEETTITKTMHIVNAPQIDKPIVLSDTILCHKEAISIQIQNSEPNVRYALRRVDDTSQLTNHGISLIGDGGTITLTSNLISESGKFYLRAISSLAPCQKDFTELINIQVEKTKADYHYSLINAKIGEQVEFNETSVEAQNFAWEFRQNGITQNASGNSNTITYSHLGETSTKLIAWSNNDCYDEIEDDGPYIYEEPSTPESCWTITNAADDLPWNGSSKGHNFTSLSKSSDGVLTTGRFTEGEIFGSQNGRSYSLDTPASIGGFLAKHDNQGTLKWMITLQNGNTNAGYIEDAVEDRDGNIYILGFDSKGFIKDTSGKLTPLGLDSAPYQWNHGGFIAKLDHNGVVLWVLQSGNNNPSKLYIDNANNLVSSGNVLKTTPTDYYLNGEVSQSVTIATSGNSIIKYNPDGAVLWATSAKLTSVNGHDIVGIDFDNQNNIFSTGFYERDAEFYSAGSNTVRATLKGRVNSYGGRTFVTKYDTNGQHKWTIKSNTVGPIHDNTKPISMVTDTFGNSYITGSNNCSYAHWNADHTFENTDGTTTTTKAGAYFVAKVNTNGVCEWIHGAENSKYGFGHGIALDNDEIYILGSIHDDSETEKITAKFTSTNRIEYDLTIGRSEYFMAVYDISGNLKRIIMNGNNGKSIMKRGVPGFFKGNNDDFYLGLNFRFYVGESDYDHFGDIIDSSKEWDGFITKFTEACGILHDNTDPQELKASLFAIQVPCHGESTGYIQAYPSGGIPPYNYVVTNSQGQEVYNGPDDKITGLAADTYELNLYDSSSRVFSKYVNIVDSEPIVLTENSTDNTKAGEMDGTIELSATGGRGPYTFTIEGPITSTKQGTTAIFGNLATGTYTIKVTDIKNCEVLSSVEIKEPTELRLEIEGLDSTCKGADNGEISLSVFNGQGPYNYEWIKVDDPYYYETTKDVSSLSPGTYVVKVVDAQNKEVTATETIKEPLDDFDNDGIGDYCDDDSDGDGVANDLDLCGETSIGQTVNEVGCAVQAVPIDNFLAKGVSETCVGSKNGSITVTSKNTEYQCNSVIWGGDNTFASKEFTESVTYTGLVEGFYTICVFVNEIQGHKQCFDITLNAPEPLAVDSKIDDSGKTVSLNLKGSTMYFIDVNGTKYTTSEDKITLPLSQTENSITVNTDKECQGVYQEMLLATFDSISIFPNPVEQGDVSVLLPSNNVDKEVLLTLFSQNGTRVLEKMEKPEGRTVKINMDGLPPGVYTIIITSETQNSMRKIIKK